MKGKRMSREIETAFVAVLCVAASASAQDVPRLSGVLPAGAQTGKTVEVSVRGSALLGAKNIWFSRPGGLSDESVSGKIIGETAKIDSSAKPLHQAKCANCHELRSPANRSLSPEQWASTVARMVKDHAAPLSPEESTKVTNYLQALTRAGELSVQITVAPGAMPGKRELRVVTANGVTSATTFIVGGLPELLSEGVKTSLAAPQKLSLPVTVNGSITAPGQRDYFAFDAKKGERVSVSLQAFRISEPNAQFFNPVIFVLNTQGTILQKSAGGDTLLRGTDPALVFDVPTDGVYTLLVRDLLYHANPLSVYRLTVGAGLPIDARFASGVVSRPGDRLTPSLAASLPIGAEAAQAVVVVPQSASWGIFDAPTALGDLPMVVTNAPDGGAPVDDWKNATAVSLPATFSGNIGKPKSRDDMASQNIFKVVTTRPNVSVYFTFKALGSKLRPWVQTFKPDGTYIDGYYGDGSADFVWKDAFKEPGTYVVHVMDCTNTGGANRGYVWEAFDAAPEFRISATPDAVNLVPGGMVAVSMQIERRENIDGAIVVTVDGLPPGVSALPCVIPPDHDRATLVLRAEANAIVAANPVTIVGTYTGADGKIAVRRAAPLDFYRVQNNQYRPLYRGTQSVAVVESEPSPAVSVTVAGAENGIALAMNKETPIVVKLSRREGFKDELFVVPMNFPPGVSLRGNTYVGGDKSEAQLSIYTDGNARFLTGERPAKNLPPMQLVFAVRPNGVGDRDYIACSAPISLFLKPEPSK